MTLSIYTSNQSIDLLAHIREEILQQGEPVYMVTVVEAIGSNPQQVGARLIAYADGGFRGTVGGGKIEATVLQETQRLFVKQQPHLFRSYNLQEIGMTCGGKMSFFFERIEPAPHVLVFGGGHIAKPTASMLKQTGFRVTVVEERAEWATTERFPNIEVICQPYEEFLQDFVPKPHQYLVLITQGHARDRIILEHVIDKHDGFLGMIGSKQKAHKMGKYLLEKGYSQELWNQVFCPIGLPLGGSSPEEIALSITSQLVQYRYSESKSLSI